MKPMSGCSQFMCSFVDKTEKCYNQNMSPAIPKDKWRKGSQDVEAIIHCAEWLSLETKESDVAGSCSLMKALDMKMMAAQLTTKPRVEYGSFGKASSSVMCLFL
ncbi:uncharacterized protein LOC120678795 isoform X2 [Panicum virgatum]|uniref:uncharacterized protein LOC120678795 isoform X2 n=1 Tax=Panicum virgatum TaxID=38727 RepID=UPI0019D51150|nr:uncharacterized protein LOC120678795 isoform X2 [Panicum virgatum]